eukprot:GHVS01055862.1.p1 GENE.GHVS01055862.1~~GHVS01055862.1.p1  ORF type:complete len:686 (+),score=68.48 GHVS01055862.1:99-2156(+)
MMICFLVFFNLLSFVIPSFSFDSDYMFVLMAVPTGCSATFDPTGTRKAPMWRVDFGGDIINNIHPVVKLLSENVMFASQRKDKDTLRSVLQPTDKFFAWIGTLSRFNEDGRGLAKLTCNREHFNNPNHTSSATFGVAKGTVVVARFANSRPSVFCKKTEEFLLKLKELQGGEAGPFAELLYGWIDGASAVGRVSTPKGADYYTSQQAPDPWQQLPFSRRMIVLDAEKEICTRALEEYRGEWKGFENTWQENANDKILPALMALTRWQLQILTLETLAVVRRHVTPTSTLDHEVDVSWDQFRDDTNIGAPGLNDVMRGVFRRWHHNVGYMRTFKQRFRNFEENLDSASRCYRFLMRTMQGMWERLYEQQQDDQPVYKARSILLRQSHSQFRSLTCSYRSPSASLREIVANAFKHKYVRLAEYAAEHQISSEGDFPQELINVLDLHIVTMTLQALEWESYLNGEEASKAQTVRRKFETVFGDTGGHHQPIDWKETKTDAVEMVRAVKRSGIKYITTVKVVIEDRKAYATLLDKLVKNYGRAREALNAGKRGDVPSDVARYLETWEVFFDNIKLTKAAEHESFLYPQMVLSLVPNSERFDAWYHLFIEALKHELSLEHGRAPKWDLTTLHGIEVPLFVAEYWQWKSHEAEMAARCPKPIPPAPVERMDTTTATTSDTPAEPHSPAEQP